MRYLSARRKKLCPGAIVGSQRFCRRAKFRARLVRYGESLANALSLVVSEHAVAILPGYVRHVPVPGVAVRLIVDAGATWDFPGGLAARTQFPHACIPCALNVPVDNQPYKRPFFEYAVAFANPSIGPWFPDEIITLATEVSR
jgi:hypothetical protein